MPRRSAGEGGEQPPHPPVDTKVEKSFEKLKGEIFDREVPDEYRPIVEHGSPFLGYGSSSGVMGGLPVKNAEMENYLRKKIGNKTLLDLGCGNTAFPRGVAQHWHAGRYIGVDANLSRGEGQYESRHGEYYYFKDDILNFVAKIKDGLGGIYLLSALEVGKYNNENDIYLDALAKEMSRTLQIGDIVVIGVGMGDDFLGHLGSEKYGFKLVTFPDTTPTEAHDWKFMGYKIYIKES